MNSRHLCNYSTSTNTVAIPRIRQRRVRRPARPPSRSPATSPKPGMTWLYTSSVMETLECPSISETIFGRPPSVSRRVAKVCLRSWKRMSGGSGLLSCGSGSCRAEDRVARERQQSPPRHQFRLPYGTPPSALSQLARTHLKAVGADLGPTAPHSSSRIDVSCRLRFDGLAGVRSMKKGRDTSAMPRSLPHP